jgi:hypothetical protein
MQISLFFARGVPRQKLTVSNPHVFRKAQAISQINPIRQVVQVVAVDLAHLALTK